MANSSGVVADGEIITAAQYNNLRTDAIGPYGDERVFPDNTALKFGTGEDATLLYDGTDLVLSPAAVGAGDLVISGASVEFDDNEGVTFGSGEDATIRYNGTDLVISPAVVGTGDLVISGASIEFDDNEGVTLGTGKDATIKYDGTNLVIDPDAVGAGGVQFHVGAGEWMSFSENVTGKITPNAAGWHEWQFIADATRYASLNAGKAANTVPGTGNPLLNLNAVSGATAADHTVRGQLSFHGIGADDVSVDIKGHSGAAGLTGLRLNADVVSGSMLPVFPTWTKTTTGDPTGSEGMWYVNTVDNVLKCYADGDWRTVASWT